MTWYGGGVREVSAFVISAELAGMPFDCEDAEPVHAWLHCPAWSSRRAFAVQASDLIEAWLPHVYPDMTWEKLVADLEWRAKDDVPLSTSFLATSVCPQLAGAMFRVELECPDSEAEPGERIQMRVVKHVTKQELDDIDARLFGRKS